MRLANPTTDWFDQLVAILYSAVLVLGLAIVVVTLVLYFPGVNTSATPLP